MKRFAWNVFVLPFLYAAYGLAYLHYKIVGDDK